MPEIEPGPDTNTHETYDEPIKTREQLASLLAYASDMEHGLACALFFAASSLKNDVNEGGLTDAQANMVRRWRRSLMADANERLFRLFQLSNMLITIGAKLHITRPTFPLSMAVNSTGLGLTLEPFSQATIDHLASYTHLDAVIATPDQPSYKEAESASYTTLGDLYDKIALGLQSLPEHELFIGASESTTNLRLLDGENSLVMVNNRNTAATAIDNLKKSIEAPPADLTKTTRLTTISTEYAATAEAQSSTSTFEPVRLVGKNPITQLDREQSKNTLINAPSTLAVAQLFNDAYDTLLMLLQQFFLPTKEDDAERLAKTVQRLINSVIRPLGDALTQMPTDTSHPELCAGAPFADSSKELVVQPSLAAFLDQQFWQMAVAATTLCSTPDLPTEVQEAAAALQDLTCQFATADGPGSVSKKIAALQQLQAEMESRIQCAVNGPYLTTNIESLTTWLGEVIPTRPMMALCRCGNSASKPFCDGTHASIDFTTQKDPKRVPDHRDTHEGTAITIFDNRGICAHSGFCTDRLSSAFHVGKEPFVTPSGARLDEIVRAVRSCPSGALSYTIGTVEAREQVDQVRPQSIEVSKDGPYRVTGGIPVKDGQGQDEVRNEGSSHEHYSLCRCGHSQNKPFCSGMHWYVNFHDPKSDPDRDPTLFEWVGGLPALLRMTHIFYEKYVPQDPILQSLFSNMSPDHPHRVAAWLGEVFGGPKVYSETYGGYSRMISQHIGKGITEEKRARWANLISRSADEAGLPADPEFRSAFASYIEWGSRLAVENSTVGAHPPLHMPMPHWNWGTAGLPSSRVSALAPIAVEKEVALPAADEAVHFTQHIKPLFREMDRQSMKWIFDLWAYEDVKKHGPAILQRLKQGSMPCDGAWASEKVTIFQRWIDTGMQE